MIWHVGDAWYLRGNNGHHGHHNLAPTKVYSKNQSWNLSKSLHSEIFKEPNRDLICAELSAIRLGDLPTARLISRPNITEILCSLIASTGASLKLISVEDTSLAKATRVKVSNTIKTAEKNIKGADAELIADASDITPENSEVLKQISTRLFADNMTQQRYYLCKK
nr:14193_t:CDS:2 [Entrophospora candida]